jgi:hypothetical protein
MTRNTDSTLKKVRHLDDELRVEGDARERRQDPAEHAGAEVDERVDGEQGDRDGRAGGPRVAVLDDQLQSQQGQHPPRRLQAEATPPGAAHAGLHLWNGRTKVAAELPASYRLAGPELAIAAREARLSMDLGAVGAGASGEGGSAAAARSGRGARQGKGGER